MAVVHAVTVHRRGREMLASCLNSLLASHGVDLQVVVVANACGEELPDVIDASPRVHLVRSERSMGFSAANNMGVAWAGDHLGRPDYYYFLNDDTRSEPDALIGLVRALEEHEGAAIAGPKLLIEWAPEHLNSLGLNVTEDGWAWDEGIGIHQDDYGPSPSRHPVVAVTGSALLIDARVHGEVGGWTELYDYYFEDIDLCLKTRAAGREVVIEPEAVVYHRLSATMTVDSEHKYLLLWRNRLLLTLIHWPLTRLPKMLKKVLVDEIVKRTRADSTLQRRALGSALRRLPAAMAARTRTRRSPREWLKMLRPAGSVPVITLPDRKMAGPFGEAPPPLPDRETVTDASSAVDQWGSKPDPMPKGPAPAPRGVMPLSPGSNELRHTLPDSAWDSARDLRRGNGNERTVLVLGWSPMPFENARMNYATGARTWQFAHALRTEGHTVCVACARMPGGYERGEGEFSEDEHDGVLVYRMGRGLFDGSGALEGLVTALDPDMVVGASSMPSLRAVRVAGNRPLWIDLFGDPMAEAQARSLVYTDGEGLGAYHDLLGQTLERGDAFSAVSNRQRHAVVGQLGLTGRLNHATAGHELVHTIPCCVFSSPKAGERVRPSLPEFGDDDFVVLWGGGYNTWCDVHVLIEAIERVMAIEPGVRFLSTGGEISGHDEDTYLRWREMVNASRFADRFTLMGCLPQRVAARYHARADLGVVTERPIYERTLGSSGRVLGWLATGLPFVCSVVSELGEQVASEGFGLTYAPGDAEDLAQVILGAVRDPDATRAKGERARVAVLKRWSVAATTQPLRQWSRDPMAAPDRDLDNPLSAAAVARLRAEYENLRATTADGRSLEAERRFNDVRSELGRIHESKMWKTWMRYYTFRDGLAAPIRWLRGTED